MLTLCCQDDEERKDPASPAPPAPKKRGCKLKAIKAAETEAGGENELPQSLLPSRPIKRHRKPKEQPKVMQSIEAGASFSDNGSGDDDELAMVKVAAEPKQKLAETKAKGMASFNVDSDADSDNEIAVAKPK